MSAISAIGAHRPGGAGGIQQIMALRQQIIDRTDLLQQLHAAQGSDPAAATASAGTQPQHGALPTL